MLSSGGWGGGGGCFSIGNDFFRGVGVMRYFLEGIFQ